MLWFRKLCRFVALPMAAVMVLMSVPLAPVHAGLVPTDTIIGTLSAERDRQTVMEFLSREDVASQFATLGLSREEATARVAAMSDAEVSSIAGRIDEMPAGQSALGVIVGAALIIFIVLLITDIAGLTNVFPFTRSAR
jgi:hypothetical protein